jgi:hypothetical protein
VADDLDLERVGVAVGQGPHRLQGGAEDDDQDEQRHDHPPADEPAAEPVRARLPLGGGRSAAEQPHPEHHREHHKHGHPEAEQQPPQLGHHLGGRALGIEASVHK